MEKILTFVPVAQIVLWLIGFVLLVVGIGGLFEGAVKIVNYWLYNGPPGSSREQMQFTESCVFLGLGAYFMVYSRRSIKRVPPLSDRSNR